MSKEVIIDVREIDEYQAESIPGSLHVPLSKFQSETRELFKSLPGDSEVLIMCRSGKRAAIAFDHVVKLGLNSGRGIKVFEGGILEWKKLDRPTVASNPTHFPIMRQVQIVAGSLMLLSAGLSYWLSPNYLLLGGFVGAGLMVAGITGFCGMANLLSLAPWNRGGSTNTK
jgi:rhodanese-related sulfurtransferase